MGTNPQFLVCLLLGVVASVEDLRRRRISNSTVLAGAAAGLIIQVWQRGWVPGPGAWLGGTAVGLAVFLVFFLAGGMGGGDVKLMAAFGACLGPAQVLRAALLTAIVGALIACGFLFWNWIREHGVQLWAAAPASLAPAPRSSESIPYAPAIFIGTLLSFLG